MRKGGDDEEFTYDFSFKCPILASSMKRVNAPAASDPSQQQLPLLYCHVCERSVVMVDTKAQLEQSQTGAANEMLGNDSSIQIAERVTERGKCYLLIAGCET